MGPSNTWKVQRLWSVSFLSVKAAVLYLLVYLHTLHINAPTGFRWGRIPRDICNPMGTAMGTPGFQFRVWGSTLLIDVPC